MLFRIEDVSGFEPNLRVYDSDQFTAFPVDKENVNEYIALRIREAINGSKNRKILSYSKSLATCLLKYNKYTDNELHICVVNGRKNYISYTSPKGNEKIKSYFIQQQINMQPFFKKKGEIQLKSFIIDVSNNASIDKYLKVYTKVGKKVFSSPEKDCEVVVMNSPNDLIINKYMDAVYILYALQLKYKFLSYANVRNALISELIDMQEFRFTDCPDERIAFVFLIQYLSSNWRFEYAISQGIYQYLENTPHFPMHYDPISQFYDITKNDFDLSYNLGSYYNDNVISDLCWKYCAKHLGYKVL